MYILAIDVCPTASMVERTIWRFPEAENTAMDSWYRVRVLAEEGIRVKDGGEIVQVISARLYLAAEAESRGMARAAVLGGLKPIRNTENPLVGLSEEEIRSLDDLIGGVAPKGEGG